MGPVHCLDAESFRRAAHYLVTHPDRLVTKDTLLDAVWPETAVSDVVVRVAIDEVRRTLGHTAQAPRFITTVHRRGYRFVVPVVEHTEEVPGPAGPALPAVPQTRLVAPPGATALPCSTAVSSLGPAPTWSRGSPSTMRSSTAPIPPSTGTIPAWRACALQHGP